ncbi:MAG: hypothetical protein EG822_18055 [Deltaproteobacteria bacterium]|nr:hypothetical protein [Deltaproteobacteria bacterium]TLN00913.1 MAG: hypothetical protein FDZ73_17805 [bacterium]
MREIAAGKGSGLSRGARQAMNATPAGREALRRIERGEGIPAGMAIRSTKDGKAFEVVKATRTGKVNIRAEKAKLARLAAENRR